jgi:hypothetical protein
MSAEAFLAAARGSSSHGVPWMHQGPHGQGHGLRRPMIVLSMRACGVDVPLTADYGRLQDYRQARRYLESSATGLASRRSATSCCSRRRRPCTWRSSPRSTVHPEARHPGARPEIEGRRHRAAVPAPDAVEAEMAFIAPLAGAAVGGGLLGSIVSTAVGIGINLADRLFLPAEDQGTARRKPEGADLAIWRAAGALAWRHPHRRRRDLAQGQSRRRARQDREAGQGARAGGDDIQLHRDLRRRLRLEWTGKRRHPHLGRRQVDLRRLLRGAAECHRQWRQGHRRRQGRIGSPSISAPTPRAGSRHRGRPRRRHGPGMAGHRLCW